VKVRSVFVLLLLISETVFAQTGPKKHMVNKDLEIVQLTEHCYLHVSFTSTPEYGRFSSNGLILVDGDKAFLFDTPPTDQLTRQLVEWIGHTLKLNLVGFIPNHWHSDCMGGLDYIQSIGIESYANQITIELAKAKNLPIPKYGFKDSLTIHLGKEIIECYYPGAGHSMDNIVVWIPYEKVLFAGCLVKSLNSEGLGNTVDGDLNAYSKTIDNVLQKYPEALIVIPGHGQIGGTELIRHTKELLNHK
jgi:metallo-beta-lactamase class B